MSTSLNLSLDHLIDYTDWERGLWHGWLRQHGDGVLAITAGSHGDGPFQTIGDLVRHIFSAESATLKGSQTGPSLTRLQSQPTTLKLYFSLVSKAVMI